MKNVEKESTLASLCSMLYEALQVNIDVYDRDYNLILSFHNPKTIYSVTIDSFFKKRISNYDRYYEKAKSRFENITENEVIVYQHNSLCICELDFKISAADEPLLFAAVGPFLIHEPSESWIHQFLSEQKLSKSKSFEYNEIRNYYMQLPYLSDRMESIAILIQHTLSTAPLLGKVSFHTITETIIPKKEQCTSDVTIEDVFKHTDNLTSTATLEYSLRTAVMQADIHLAFDVLTQLYTSYQTMLFDYSPLERQQHFLNYLNTLSRTACTDGNGDVYSAFKASQTFALKISQVQNHIDVRQLYNAMLTTYCQLVLDAMIVPYSALVKAAVAFIRSEYRKNLSLSLVAKETFVSESHLSRLFKAETGMTVREFLNYTRVQQAISLMPSTRFPITEIALMVGFSSYAKFSVEFKKYTGMSAREYKQMSFFSQHEQ